MMVRSFLETEVLARPINNMYSKRNSSKLRVSTTVQSTLGDYSPNYSPVSYIVCATSLPSRPCPYLLLPPRHLDLPPPQRLSRKSPTVLSTLEDYSQNILRLHV